jgi:hypothetical protein
VRERYRRECAGLSTVWVGALWASERWLGRDTAAGRKARELRGEIEAEFGWRARLAAPLVGGAVLLAMHRENARLRRGLRYEPRTFYETNAAGAATRGDVGPEPCRQIAPPIAADATRAA